MENSIQPTKDLCDALSGYFHKIADIYGNFDPQTTDLDTPGHPATALTAT